MTDQTITLDGTSSREMANDVASLTFEVNMSGKQAESVQTAMRESVHAALDVVRPFVKDEEVEMSTDSFQVEPHYTKTGKMDGYTGRAQITVKGTDTARIAQLASDVKTMVVSSSNNSMSKALRMSVEAELMKDAIADFSSKADAVAKAFGFKSWTLGSVSVSTSTSRPHSFGKVMALGGAAMESSPMPIESGKSTMTGSVRGNIVLSKKAAA